MYCVLFHSAKNSTVARTMMCDEYINAVIEYNEKLSELDVIREHMFLKIEDGKISDYSFKVVRQDVNEDGSSLISAVAKIVATVTETKDESGEMTIVVDSYKETTDDNTSFKLTADEGVNFLTIDSSLTLSKLSESAI